MTNFQFYLLAQAYGSGTYGCKTYQSNGECDEQTTQTTQTTQPDVTAPSTGVLRQDNSLSFAVMATIVIASLVIAGVVLYVKKRIAKNK